MLGNRQMTSRFSTKPLYLQVRDALAERVATGEWKPGAAISNEGDLAREFGVSSGTMRKALDLLEEERLLTRRQGRGTFVNDQSSGDLAVRYSNIRTLAGDHVVAEVKYLEVSEAPVTEIECARLRIRMHDRVVRARRLRSSEGKPFMLEQIAMPAGLFPDWASKRVSRPASWCWRSSTGSCSARGTSASRSVRRPMRSPRPCSWRRPRRC